MMNRYRKTLGLLLAAGMIVLTLPLQAQKQPKEFKKWPAGSSPREIGKRVAERLLAIPHSNFGRPGPPPFITYPEVATWYGALTFAQLSGDKELDARLIKRFDPLFGNESNLIPVPDHVDRSVFGTVPLEIYIQTKEKKYLDLGLNSADKQWDDPTPDGLSSQTRYWIDDMYMLIILQLQAYRATGDAKYLDRAALEMTTYLDKLQQPNGLFYHAPDVKYFWGRGDGWVAAGMAEMLSELPENHPERARILKGYKLMMSSLLKYQGKDGMWRELIDKDDAWPESSSSAMFAFGMIMGVKHGWLDAATYGPAARKAWIAVVGYVDQNHDVTQVCEGTGKKDSLEYYYQRKRRTGDFHGQAPVLWTAGALLANGVK